MFYFIEGPLALLKPGFAVISASGVGYKMTISDRTYATLSSSNATNVKLFSHLAVREDGIELFGFQTEAELDTFLLLTSVQGVGPKAAIAILSQFTPEQFVFAVVSEDKKAISKANGIGPKIAARIVLELHDKLAGGSTLADIGSGSVPPVANVPAAAGGALRDAQEALVVLGYGRSEILAALQGIDTAGMSTEDIVRAVLKKLMR